MRDLWLDLRFGLRSLGRAPGFTLAALATLAIGIGAGTAVFGVIDGVLLRRLPYGEPDRLVRVWPQRPMSGELYDSYRRVTRTLEAVSAAERALVGYVVDGEAEELVGTRVTPGHLELLALRPLLGRAFSPADARPGAEAVVLLGHGLWQRRFAGSRAALGRRVEIDGSPATVIGVLPPEHRPVLGAGDLWLPLVLDPADEHHYRDNYHLAVFGRLAPGEGPASATAELSSWLRRLGEETPGRFDEEVPATARVDDLSAWMLGDRSERLTLLAGAVLLVLLVACANVANLQLARMASRGEEIAVRTALGAGRGRVARQLLTESTLLGLAGGALGLGLAQAALALTRSRLEALFPTAPTLGIDLRVLSFALLLSLTTGIAFGLAPALGVMRRGPGAALRRGGRGGSPGRERYRLQRGLVLAEVAAALVLLVGAALVGKSLWGLARQDLGLTEEGVLTLRLSPPAGRFGDDAALQALWAEVLERAAAVPGVEAVGLASHLPIDGGIMGTTFATRDRPRRPGEAPMTVDVRIVSPGTFRALGVPILRGRPLTAADRTGPAGLVNEALAERLWPGEDPIGREILWDNGDPWFTIAGVVGDMRQRGPGEEPRAEAYRMVSQEVWGRSMYLVVRTAGEPRSVERPLAAAIHGVDPTTPISRVRTLAEVTSESLAPRRFVTVLFVLFGLVALSLGAVGVYGVTAYVLGGRRHELGVRIALGASPASVVRTALGQALRPVFGGLALGALLALALTRLLGGLLVGVSALDPVVWLAVAAGLGLLATLAAWVPARRAARADPRESLLSA